MNGEPIFPFPPDEPVTADPETGRIVVLHTDQEGTHLIAVDPTANLLAAIIDRALLSGDELQ